MVEYFVHSKEDWVITKLISIISVLVEGYETILIDIISILNRIYHYFFTNFLGINDSDLSGVSLFLFF